jgi:hypothetical protein
VNDFLVDTSLAGGNFDPWKVNDLRVTNVTSRRRSHSLSKKLGRRIEPMEPERKSSHRMASCTASRYLSLVAPFFSPTPTHQHHRGRHAAAGSVVSNQGAHSLPTTARSLVRVPVSYCQSMSVMGVCRMPSCETYMYSSCSAIKAAARSASSRSSCCLAFVASISASWFRPLFLMVSKLL